MIYFFLIEKCQKNDKKIIQKFNEKIIGKNSCLAFFLEKDNKISVIFSLLKKIYMFF